MGKSTLLMDEKGVVKVKDKSMLGKIASRKAAKAQRFL
jgi:hypothetical protein